MRFRVTVALIATALAFTACRALLGSLDDCSTDADCAAHGPLVTCTDRLCVTDTRCSTIGQTGGDALVFGMVIPLTTDGTTPDPNGPSWRDAVALVVNALNPPVQQGLSGKPLGVIVCDDLGDPDIAAELAQRFVTAGIQAIMSGGSSETLNVASVTVPAKVLLLSGYSQSPEVTNLSASADGVRLVWRTIEPDQFVTRVLVKTLVATTAEGGAPPPVAVLARNDSYGQGFYGLFQPTYPGPQEGFFFDPSGDADAPGLAAAASYGAPVAVMWAFPEDIDRLLNEIEAPAYAPLQQTSWYFNDQMLVPGTLNALLNPSRYNGSVCVAAAPADTSSPAFSWLQAEYEETYGADPSQSPSVASYADAIMLIAVAAGVDTVQGKPTDGVHLAEILGQLSAADSGPLVPLDPTQFTVAVTTLASGTPINVEGASGPLDFDAATGEAPSNTNVYSIVDGSFVITGTVGP